MFLYLCNVNERDMTKIFSVTCQSKFVINNWPQYGSVCFHIDAKDLSSAEEKADEELAKKKDIQFFDRRVRKIGWRKQVKSNKAFTFAYGVKIAENSLKEVSAFPENGSFSLGGNSVGVGPADFDHFMEILNDNVVFV